MKDRVGEIVELMGAKWKIVVDDSQSQQLKKEYDFVLQNVETGESIKIFAIQLQLYADQQHT